MSVIETSNTDEIRSIIAEGGVVVVDFGAESWCAPCRALHKHYDAAAERLSETRPGVKLIRADIDEGPDLASEYGIQGVPALLAYDDGEFVGRVEARTAVALVREIEALSPRVLRAAE